MLDIRIDMRWNFVRWSMIGENLGRKSNCRLYTYSLLVFPMEILRNRGRNGRNSGKYSGRQWRLKIRRWYRHMMRASIMISIPWIRRLWECELRLLYINWFMEKRKNVQDRR